MQSVHANLAYLRVDAQQQLCSSPVQVITRKASTRVAEFAFKYAQDHNRKLVSAVHKANIMKKADGLFLECCRCEGGSRGSEAAQGSETGLTAAA